jgi:hypothetical protein
MQQMMAHVTLRPPSQHVTSATYTELSTLLVSLREQVVPAGEQLVRHVVENLQVRVLDGTALAVASSPSADTHARDWLGSCCTHLSSS